MRAGLVGCADIRGETFEENSNEKELAYLALREQIHGGGGFNVFAHSARPGRGILSMDCMDWTCVFTSLSSFSDN